MVERVLENKEVELSTAALNMIATEIKSATSSMTSVPKPLKFMRAHNEALMAHFETLAAGPVKVRRLLCKPARRVARGRARPLVLPLIVR